MSRVHKERKEPARGSKRSLSDLILKVLEGVGMLAVAFIAPNAVQLFDLTGRQRQFPRKQFRNALKRLEKKGYIACASERNAWDFRLTRR